MPDTINLTSCRSEVDNNYVGFLINGPKVKPVHIANGVMRIILGKILDISGVEKLSFVESKKGRIGYKTEDIVQMMIENDTIEDDIEITTFEATRRVLQKLLDSDGTYYDISDKNMVSYPLSSKYFVRPFAMYQDAGEFIGGVIKKYCPELTDHIYQVLDKGDDPISLIFRPVTNDTIMSEYSKDRLSNIRLFNKPNTKLEEYICGIKTGGQCLLHNLENQPNAFTKLRLFNFFCIFHLFRYLAHLESFYCGGTFRPMLFDFTGKSGSVADASAMSYSQIHKALSRFYAWSYSELLAERGLSSELLQSEEPPLWQQGRTSKSIENEILGLWEMAKEEALGKSDKEGRFAFGRAMYDMLAGESKFHPVTYLRSLGVLSGFLYPPNNSNNRFSASHDILEMLIMSTIEPGETINGKDIRERLWYRCGVIIGGRVFEEKIMHENGAIMQVDSDSLEDNFQCFSNALVSLGFAEIMADGILQIHLGGVQK